jgi:signal transduction histidine kinase
MKRRQRFAERSVDVIIDQADRLERLIRDLTDVSRLEAGHLSVEPEPMDLVELVYGCAEQARGQAREHVIRVDGPEEPIVGRWDRDRLAEVLTNLLSNAIKYSPEGGEVLVTIEQREDDVLVAVHDQGSASRQSGSPTSSIASTACRRPRRWPAGWAWASTSAGT